MFYDETKVFLKAGDGGDGCMSFLRQKYMPKGGPNGGNGGKGGDVVLYADENISDLRTFHFKKHWKAKNGEPGRGSDQNGKGGEVCVLKLPLGTEVRVQGEENVFCELLKHGDEIIILEGGKEDEVIPHLSRQLIKHLDKQLRVSLVMKVISYLL